MPMDTSGLAQQILRKLIVCCLLFPGGITCVLGQLVTTSDCSCVGYATIYQCTTTGNGVTTFRGSAFNCPLAGNKIRLRHEKFNAPSGASGSCNEEEIVGRSLHVKGNNYSSQLSVNMTDELNGTMIECVYEDLASNTESKIGQIQLTLTKEPFDAPSDVLVMDAGPGYLLFSWSSVANSCVPLHYDVSSTCGVCPSVTNDTSALCTIEGLISHNTRECSFKIRSVTCGNIAGNWSDSLRMTLKVPEPPVITGIQASYDANGLTGLVVNYRASLKDVFNISRGIDGYVRNFTTVYSDGLTNLSCTPQTTPSLNSSLPLSCFPLQLVNSNVTVSVSASNRLGKGNESIIVIAATNEYVNLSTSSEKITCQFIPKQESSNDLRSCNASYGECGKPKRWKSVLGNATGSLTVISIDLLSDNITREYCYKVTATINNFTVIIHGSHSKGVDGAQAHPVLMTAVVVFAALLLSVIAVVASIIIAFKFYRKYHPYGVYAIIFELLDQPWQLLKILGGLKDLKISINETKIGECTPKGTRKIYMRFDGDISKEQAKRMKRKISGLKLLNRKMMDSRVANSVKSIPIYELEPMTTIGERDSVPNGSNLKIHQYSRRLPQRSGALYALILGIKDLSSANDLYGDINFTGIGETARGIEGTSDIEISLTFACERALPPNWKKDFDNIKLTPSFAE